MFVRKELLSSSELEKYLAIVKRKGNQDVIIGIWRLPAPEPA